MKAAIMQPYVFPYIGYFQLINAVDTFVFFDDVNFIKKGFINRNYLLFQKQKSIFNISCKKISQNKKINKTELDFNTKERLKLLQTIQQNYKNAPFFDSVFPLLNDFVMSFKSTYISEMAIESVLLISKYLDLNTKFEISSETFSDNADLLKEKRLIQICKNLNATHYINPIGGMDLYQKEDFKNESITLSFLKSNTIEYTQFNNDFVPWLSIIDVVMFNSINDTKNLLNEFRLL